MKKNEFAFFECSTKQVFQNSDLFFTGKKQKNFFIGESVITKPIDNNKINKALGAIVKKSKKSDLKKILSKHGFHLTINKQTYQIDLRSFNHLRSILQHLNKRGKPQNGVSVKDKKFYSIKNKINIGSVDSLKIKISEKFYFYKGLYWSK